jgi:uncharacterized DUF497 family protein
LPEPLAFEWDPRKAALNLAKHLVSFEEAVTGILSDELPMILAIPKTRCDSYCSDNQIAIGYSWYCSQSAEHSPIDQCPESDAA